MKSAGVRGLSARMKPINLFVPVYKSESPARQRELNLCLDLNEKNPLLSVIPIFKQDRVSFGEMVNRVNCLADDDTISIIANSDIVFDESIALARGIQENEVYWLSRYDGVRIEGDSINTKAAYLNTNIESSDSWIFKGKINVSNIDFQLGTWGCDGAFANRLKRAGYRIWNPSRSIKTYHVHESNFRTNQFPQAPKPWNGVAHCSVEWMNNFKG